jgi:hypothetical protein
MSFGNTAGLGLSNLTWIQKDLKKKWDAAWLGLVRTYEAAPKTSGKIQASHTPPVTIRG